MKTTAGFISSIADGIRAFRSLVQTKEGKQKQTRYRNLVSYALAYKATDLSIQGLDNNIAELRMKLPSAATQLQKHQDIARAHLLKVRRLYFNKVHRMIDPYSIEEYNKIRKLMGLPTKNVGMISRLQAQLRLKADSRLKHIQQKLRRTE